MIGGIVAMYMRHGVPIKWHIQQNYTFTYTCIPKHPHITVI